MNIAPPATTSSSFLLGVRIAEVQDPPPRDSGPRASATQAASSYKGIQDFTLETLETSGGCAVTGPVRGTRRGDPHADMAEAEVIEATQAIRSMLAPHTLLPHDWTPCSRTISSLYLCAAPAWGGRHG